MLLFALFTAFRHKVARLVIFHWISFSFCLKCAEALTEACLKGENWQWGKQTKRDNDRDRCRECTKVLFSLNLTETKADLNLACFGSPSCSDWMLACSRALLTTSSFSSWYVEQVEYITAKTLGTTQQSVHCIKILIMQITVNHCVAIMSQLLTFKVTKSKKWLYIHANCFTYKMLWQCYDIDIWSFKQNRPPHQALSLKKRVLEY